MSSKALLFTSMVTTLLTSCAVIRPGEVGMKQKFGKLSDPKENGVIGYNPFIAKVIKLRTQTTNIEVLINLPSKEGLTIKSEISILYNINPKAAKKIINEIG
ncbi:MAG: SPFH domain-containing protein, partial [Bacteroidota bacterium]